MGGGVGGFSCLHIKWSKISNLLALLTHWTEQVNMAANAHNAIYEEAWNKNKIKISNCLFTHATPWLGKKSAWRDELRRRLRTRLHRFSDARNDRKNKERVTFGNHGLLFQVAFLKKTQRLQNFHFILCWTNSVLYTIGSIVDYFKNSSLN